MTKFERGKARGIKKKVEGSGRAAKRREVAGGATEEQGGRACLEDKNENNLIIGENDYSN